MVAELWEASGRRGGWLWPRRTASVATGAFGRKEQRRGERLGEREGVQGGSASPWRRLGASERGQAGREGGGGRRGRARAGTQLLRGEGRKTTGGGGLGRAGPVLLGYQVGFTGKSPGMCSVLIPVYVFYFF